MEKQKLKITLKVLNEVTAEFPEFIEERLEQKCAKVDEVYFFNSLKAKN